MCSIKDCFPYLADNIFSPVTIKYNCFAWAAGQDFCIWSPEPFDQYYWPSNAPKDEALDSYILAYGFISYELSPDNNPELEPGFEKIALYVDSFGKVTHATRQIAKGANIGKWTSKIGDLEDILHETYDFLEGNDFGFLATILRRRITLETDS
ncbi:MAG: hypothetical protein KME27_26630 [Lyngbya sp. HA4199-MV5]|jgi:hypothetical protein|nr:hypothetical protein [Lyngbya sp. HA4199-MV5]